MFHLPLKIVLASVLLLCPIIASGRPDCSREKDADVLILGAGFAGLGAAERLSENGIENFLIIDQRDKIGGRAQSVKFGGTTVELGPQWILNADPSLSEEQRQPLLSLAQQCNITYREAPLGSRGRKVYRDGLDITQSPELRRAIGRLAAATAPAMTSTILEGLGQNDDLSVAGGLRAAGWLPRSTIDEFVEYSNFALEHTATLGYKDFFDPAVISERVSFGTSMQNLIVTDDVGFVGLAQCVADKFLAADDPRLILDTTVKSVAWSDDCVCATVEQDGQEKEYCGTYAIVTFSIGVLQNRAVKFDPDLPLNVHLTLNKLQMARFLKVFAVFNETFWDTDVDNFFVIDEINGIEYYPQFTPWGAYFADESAPVLQTILFRDIAERVSFQDKEITRRQIGQVLRTVYGDKASDPVDIIMGDFIANPHFYGNLGGVSAPGVTNKTYRILNEPIGNVFLGGDGVAYSYHSTAHGALISGYVAGNRVVAAFKLPPTITFINDSPRVNGRTLSAEFSISKAVSLVECSLDGGQRTDCSSGSIEYPNLSQGRHVLKVIARNAVSNDRGVAVRSIYTNDSPHCAVHLINGGVSVYEGKVSIEFASTGLPVSTFSCNVDSVNIFPCMSPLNLDDLSSGSHRIRIRPVCEGNQRQRTFSFLIT